MTEWVFFVLPLLVLPIVLLFRFVGCGLNTKGEIEPEIPLPKKPIPPEVSPFEPIPTQAPSYRATIIAEPDLIAYWRLVDDPSDIPVDGSAPEAKDENKFQNGKYIKVPPGLPPETGSEPANGDFDSNQTSLIANQPVSTKCRSFKGGYVRVESKPDLYKDEFTIEAWINPQWTEKTGYEHTLIAAYGRYRKIPGAPVSWHGFRIFADQADRWRIYLAKEDGSGIVPMTAPPIVVHNAPTHLAVTVKTDADGKKQVTMFVNVKPAAGTAERYSRPDGAPLFIGVNNTEPNPSNTPKPRHPVLSPIQEVALYKKALSPEVIKKHYDIGIGKGDV